ncbi:MAG TPA: M1 family metallopeptidase [Acidimicrobiales bacterium]|nr:M1 family metallopeptidase [Acidimicrobiales bacterium]
MTSTANPADRLPRSAVPRRYDLELAPEFESCRFEGNEEVQLEVLDEVAEIVLNADGLSVTDATITPGWAATDGAREPAPLTVSIDAAATRVRFGPAAPLPPGHYTLGCRFAGALNDQLRGFYRSRFVDDAGQERTIATTQFEETDARKAFPCFDEPDLKAVFGVTLVAPPGMLAVSNGAETSVETLPTGARRVHFADTIPMSTYLVAFVVGPLVTTDPTDVDGIALRVVTVPGKAHLTSTAVEVAAHALRYYREYFAIPYPGDKLDLVAIPDFAAGAMENLGCVTFREAELLADPKDTARPEMRRIAEVIEHELAHMWFGDLVTLRWWNGVWLNEAFATFMALRCQDDYHPDWQCFVGFARLRELARFVDGLHSTRAIEFPVNTPEEASAMFDVPITYIKGPAVLWMIEQYLGHDRFRAGVRRYLKTHAFGNAETTDLWEAIEAENPDVPLRAAMGSWVFQGGYPVVRASQLADPDGATIELRQEPFSYLPAGTRPDSSIGARWLVPILAASADNRDEVTRVLLADTPVRLAARTSPIVVSAGGTGFYRVRYDEALREGLLAHLELLDPVERLDLLGGLWAAVLAGVVGLDAFLGAVVHFAGEDDPYIWSVVTTALRTLDLVAPARDRELVARYTRSVLQPEFARLGWEASEGEGEQTPILRSSLLVTLGTFGGDTDVVARARELFGKDQSGRGEIDADIAGAVLSIVAWGANREEFDAIVNRVRRPRSPLDEERQLRALGSLTDVAWAAEVHELCRQEIRSQDAPYLLGVMLGQREIGPATWAFISTHFDELAARYPNNSIHRMLEGMANLAELDAAGESVYASAVGAFVEAHFAGGKKRLLDQIVEHLEVNVRLATNVSTSLRETLSAD